MYVRRSVDQTTRLPMIVGRSVHCAAATASGVVWCGVSVRLSACLCVRLMMTRPTTTTTVKCCYLVDPASSHMLVSKIKPCMSKYKHLYCETANGSLNQLSFI